MLRIQLNSSVPIYQQLVEEVKRMIADNELRAGDALPTIRALATQLDVAINTVARAYQELVTLGLAESRGSGGTVIKARANGSDPNERVFRDSIRRLLQRGMNRKEIEEVFEKELAIFFD
jgi:DNA-binding transcriptional regulator YhcF (GntR family)